MRRKAYTVSSPTVPEGVKLSLGTTERRPDSLKLERRKTFLEGQPSPRILEEEQWFPRNESGFAQTEAPKKSSHERKGSIVLMNESHITRLESNPDTRPDRRLRLLINTPPIRPSWLDRRSIMIAKEKFQLEATKETVPLRPGYVDSAIQTEPELIEPAI